jgi:hypothetical protein
MGMSKPRRIVGAVLYVVLMVAVSFLKDDWPEWVMLLVFIPLGLIPTALILIPDSADRIVK